MLLLDQFLHSPRLMKYLPHCEFAKLSPHQKAWHIWQTRREITKNKLATRVAAVKMQHGGKSPTFMATS